MKHKLLIIEDEEKIRKFMRISLKTLGFAFEEAEKGLQGVRMAAALQPDLIICDLNLPDMDGMDVISQIREASNTPIIVLSARSEDEDIVRALDKGADDYLVKPFNMEVLTARIRANLRKSFSGTDEKEPTKLTSGAITMDLMRHEVFKNEEKLELSPKEYKLLKFFLENEGKMLTHEMILEQVWGKAHVKDTHYLRIYIAQLRQKIDDTSAENRLIVTEPGIGYRFEKIN